MNRTVRMLGIIMRLQRGKATLAELAERFECSTKSIQRDLDQMLTLGIPVATSRGRNGGITIEPGWWLGPLNLTADEIETVILAMESAAFLPGADEVLAKIRAAVRPNRFDPVAHDPTRPQVGTSPGDTPGDILSRIRTIMAREMWCVIDYAGGSNPGWRAILPQQLHISDGHWYVAAIDERSREFRTFRLDRIHDLTPTLGPPDAAAIIEHARAQPAYHSSTYPQILAELTPTGVDFCQNHPRLRNCLVGSTLRFHCPPADYPYMARDFLRMGTNCRVLEPDTLKSEMLLATQELLYHLENKLDTGSSS